ncbi:MAG: histidine kinase [Chitinophagaceae bacterium]|nr:histidine kinase [Chitinophagaceae bacterium]
MRKFIGRIVFFLSIVFTCTSIRAQDPFSVNYSIAEGLPSTNIYSVFQEKNGIIWFTTDVGIVKYNSKSFELFNTDDGLSDNEVFRLIPDSRGRLWMQTVNGKPSFIFKGKIYNENNSALLKEVRGAGMTIDIFEDDQKTVYLGFKNGEISMIDKQDSVTRKNIYPEQLSGFWQSGSVYAFGSEFSYNVSNNDQHIISSPPVSFRLYHSAGKTFLSNKSKLFIPGKDEVKLIAELDDVADILNVVVDGEKLWICTRDGIVLFEDGRIKNTYFKEHLVSDLLKDLEGNYWITTLNKGVLFIPSLQVKQLLKEKKLSCLGVSPDKELWVGGFENDIYIKNSHGLTERLLYSNWPKNKISNFRFFGGTGYVAAKSGIERNINGKATAYRSSINDILPVDDYLFIATTFTARVLKSEFTETNLSTIYKKVILQKRTNVLCKDNVGNVWMGTNFGLFRYNAKDSITDFGIRYDDLAISIEDLYFDPESNLLLVATASKGLVILKENRFVKRVNSKAGLNSNTVNTIKKIGLKTYLLGSNNGINKLELTGDTNQVKLSNYNANFGFINKRVRDIELVDDTVYMALDQGLLYFNADYLDIKTVNPRCIITAVKTAFENNNTIHYKNNSISFTYTGISFIDRGQVEYYYRLDGQDNKWTSTKETQINYKSLPAGNYRFEVYCVNGFGQKSEIQETDFEILPPFWQTWWFRILAVLIAIFLIYFVFRIRLKEQRIRFEKESAKIGMERDKARMEKQMVELEQRALRMQMNPHFIFNGLNTIKGYYAEGNFLNASTYITKFSKLLRKLLESEEQVTTLDNEIEMLKLYIELTQIRYEGKFDYEISISDNIRTADILIPNLLLQPLVENAILYGLGPKTEKGLLHISFREEENEFICVVDDNGVGREIAMKNQKNRDHKSKATNITLERLALFDKRSKMVYVDKVTDGHAEGTKVIITMPIKKTDEDENINY